MNSCKKNLKKLGKSKRKRVDERGIGTSRDCIWDGYSIWKKILERWIERRIRQEDVAAMTNQLRGERRSDLRRLRFPNPCYSLCLIDFGEKLRWCGDWKWKERIWIERRRVKREMKDNKEEGKWTSEEKGTRRESIIVFYFLLLGEKKEKKL
jgi:hypothetical protein